MNDSPTRGLRPQIVLRPAANRVSIGLAIDPGHRPLHRLR